MILNNRVVRALIPLCIVLLAVSASIGGDDAGRKLRFLYETGAKYRILTEVNEDVYLNGVHSHISYILNKISVNTADAKDGSGRLDCDFQMSERLQGKYNVYFLKEDYHSVFWRDALGVYTIDPSFYMPVVRNVPRFPSGTVKPGDTWFGDAEEVHDLRRGYGIQDALHFPVKAQYTYLRDEVKDGVNTAVLKVEYTTFHKVEYRNAPLGPVPVRITGTSTQTFWWNLAAGQYHSYHEDFDYLFYLSNASHIEYKGTADGRLLRSAALDRDALVDSLNKRLKEEKIADTAAKKDKKGVTIVMENVNFPPYSHELTAPEREKLARIASILKQFPDRDFLITGHTARVGEEQTSQLLSEQRAQAVADFLISRGACGRTRVMTQGKGSREPAADNAAEEGRKKNRRVEITILEN